MTMRNAKEPSSPRRRGGFTLIELMVVIAVMGVMATMAVPSFQDRMIRAQVGEGLALADFARQAVAAHHARTRGGLPRDNAAAGLPPAERIVGNYVSSVAVRSGAIDIRFGNLANRNLSGKTLTLRPAVVEGYPQVPVAWVCGTAPSPGSMKLHGDNATDLPGHHLPIDCRDIGGAPRSP